MDLKVISRKLILTCCILLNLKLHASQNLEQNQDDKFNFNGIVSIGLCSGSLIKFDQSNENDKAIALTNAHCLEIPNFNSALENYILNETQLIRILSKEGAEIGYSFSDKIIYATIQKTDIALYQLEDSYNDLYTKYGVKPLTLSKKPPSDNTPIEILSGFWKLGYKCYVDQTVHRLIEGDWIWEKSIRYSGSGCETPGGSSGSPVLESGTRNLIAIHNTANENGEKCTEDNPCQEDEYGKITYQKDLRYGQQIYWINTCLDKEARKLNLNLPGCQLPKP